MQLLFQGLLSTTTWQMWQDNILQYAHSPVSQMIQTYQCLTYVRDVSISRYKLHQTEQLNIVVLIIDTKLCT